MENYYKEKGVFLSSANLDSTILLDCLRALISHYPSMRFTSITTDDKLQGFRVLFSGPEIKAVLEKKQLRIDDEVVGIYPLTTVLSICDIGAFENPLFEEDVLEAISEKYGKVFDVIKFDSEAVLDALSKKFDNSFDAAKAESLEKKWRVRIDIPEFEGLEIFRSDCERMIYLPKWNRNLKVTFWCRCCKMSGHFQNSCPKKLQPVVAVRSESIVNGKSNSNDENILPSSIQLQSVSTLGKDMSSENFESYNPETTDSFAEVERTPKAKKSRNSDEDNTNSKRMKTNESVTNVSSDKNKNFLPMKNIKKEIVEEDEDDDEGSNKKMTSGAECDNSDTTDHENQSDTDTDVRRFMSYEEDTKLFIDTASNDATDFAGKAALEAKSEENSNSTFADDKEKEKIVPSRTSTPSGPSHPATTATSNSILGAADTSILSDELQGYINHACETIGALDRQTLDAFLGYVKKKNKPTQIALKYTPHVGKLKEQLQMILTLRYHTKPTNQVKEDAVFIKWLEGLVSRFDNTKPSKRKRPGID